MMKNKPSYLIRYLPLIPLYIFIGAILFGLLFNITISYFLALIPLIYMILKGIIGNFTSHMAISRIKKNVENAPHLSLPDQANRIQHVIMVPVFRESNEYLYRRLIHSIQNNVYPYKGALSVVFVTEENDDISRGIVSRCVAEYSEVYEIVHPREENILPGKSAAMAYAGRVLSALRWPEKLKDDLKDNVLRLRGTLSTAISGKEVLVHDTDIDMLFPRGYFKHLTQTYINDNKRNTHAYQPAIMLINNFENVPNISMTTGAFVSYNAAGGQYSKILMMFSSYAMSLSLLKRIGFWRTDVIQEDSGLYWKAKMKLGRKFKVVPLFMPLFGDSVNTGEWKETFRAQTKQIVRWAYGVDDLRHTISEKSSLWIKVYSIFVIFQNHVLWEIGGFLGAYTYFIPLLILMPIPRLVTIMISAYFTIAWPMTWVGVLVAMHRLSHIRDLEVGAYLQPIHKEEFVRDEDYNNLSKSPFGIKSPLLMAFIPSLLLPMLDVYRQTNIALPLEMTSIGGLYLLQHRKDKAWVKNSLLLLGYPAALFYNSMCAFYAAHIAAVKGKIKYEVTKKV